MLHSKIAFPGEFSTALDPMIRRNSTNVCSKTGNRLALTTWACAAHSSAAEFAALHKEEWMHRFLTVVLLFALSATIPRLAAQQQQPPGNEPNSRQPQADTNTRESARTLQGKIARADEQLVFWDPASQTAYQLDDQSKVAPYEGKNVKLVATVDPKTNTLHIMDVSPAEK
jgi:hypothetical protein